MIKMRYIVLPVLAVLWGTLTYKSIKAMDKKEDTPGAAAFWMLVNVIAIAIGIIYLLGWIVIPFIIKYW